MSQVLTEAVAGSSNERSYIYTPSGQLLYHVDSELSAGLVSGAVTASYYHYDITGSTVALSGDDGLVKGRVSYTAYGEITSRTGNTDTRFLFCGAYGVQTDTSGLVYMRARYYHPYLCRFLNEDPIGFEGGMNWFAYASGDPFFRSDPTGLTDYFLGLNGSLAIGIGINGGFGIVIDSDNLLDSGIYGSIGYAAGLDVSIGGTAGFNARDIEGFGGAINPNHAIEDQERSAGVVGTRG
jgi:RHS repeat-associated protein